ncbi:MAG: hypothetical protein RI883_2323 [Bacteroidota bacterium]|jgi:NAD(P)H-hydrate epimerase
MKTTLSKEFIQSILKPREKNTHKGTYGHALIIAGSEGIMGSAVLASKACLRSGVGLVTVHIPKCGAEILQNSIPEAMLSIDSSNAFFADNIKIDTYSVVAFGPGIGTNDLTQKAVHTLLGKAKLPMVIDADGLNCLSLNKEWFSMIPKNSILTPHPKEFERLVGTWENDEQKIEKLIALSNQLESIVVLKGEKTLISIPGGDLYVNSTGNPAMAKGGSGDVLTGMITAFLSQGYSSEESAVLGVYIHGFAGDIAVKEFSEYSLLATDLIEFIPKAFLKLIK